MYVCNDNNGMQAQKKCDLEAVIQETISLIHFSTRILWGIKYILSRLSKKEPPLQI